MQFTLNINTHRGDLAIIDHDWTNAQRILTEEGFDGYEIYPVGNHPWETIPKGMMIGMHLRFHPVLTPFWHEDRGRLLEIFGDETTVASCYGGLTPDTLVAAYQQQLALACQLGCAYVVFHLANCEFDYIYNWCFPWGWRDTIDVCAEVLGAVFEDTPFTGELLLENLWWPGSFRALDPSEIFYALERVAYPRTGIVLDTGHLLNTNQQISSEAEGIAFLLSTVRELGEARSAIRGVHLTRSLSAEYVKRTKSELQPISAPGTFWDRYHQALQHVRQIDQHDAFEDPAIAGLFEVIDPAFVTYEFTFASREEWMAKARRQRTAMARVHVSPVAA